MPAAYKLKQHADGTIKKVDGIVKPGTDSVQMVIRRLQRGLDSGNIGDETK